MYFLALVIWTVWKSPTRYRHPIRHFWLRQLKCFSSIWIHFAKKISSKLLVYIFAINFFLIQGNSFQYLHFIYILLYLSLDENWMRIATDKIQNPIILQIDNSKISLNAVSPCIRAFEQEM